MPFSNRNFQGGSISTFKQSLSDDRIFKWCYQQPPDPLISITLPFIKVKLDPTRTVSLAQKEEKLKRNFMFILKRAREPLKIRTQKTPTFGYIL